MFGKVEPAAFAVSSPASALWATQKNQSIRMLRAAKDMKLAPVRPADQVARSENTFWQNLHSIDCALPSF
jgi:hypothetical protein